MTTSTDDLFSSIVTGGVGQAAFDAFVAQVGTEQAVAKRTTVAQRKEQLRQAVEAFDLDRLIELQDKASSIVDLITNNELHLDGENHVLENQLVTALMKEILVEREIKELIDMRNDVIRAAIFAHLTALAEARGEEFPEHTNGSVEVPTEGKKFTREGTGQKTPILNENKLRALLGEERWEAVCDVTEVPEQVIPAHTEYSVSGEKIIAAAADDPAILELVKQSLEAGGWKTPKFHIRNL